ALISAPDPTAAIRFPQIATASACAWRGSIVWTEAFIITRSGEREAALIGIVTKAKVAMAVKCTESSFVISFIHNNSMLNRDSYPAQRILSRRNSLQRQVSLPAGCRGLAQTASASCAGSRNGTQ